MLYYNIRMTKRDETTARVLDIISKMEDGARPVDLRDELGISVFYAAVILSRFRKKGLVVKRLCDDGRCRYLLASKGERKRAYLESLKEE